jgi:hypothetical protein
VPAVAFKHHSVFCLLKTRAVPDFQVLFHPFSVETWGGTIPVELAELEVPDFDRSILQLFAHWLA